MKRNILLFSQAPLTHIANFSEKFRFTTILFGRDSQPVKSNDSLAALLTRENGSFVVIDGHLGENDMQLIGEIAGMEGKGLSAMRTKILAGKNVPLSFRLLQKIRTLEPRAAIIFITHKKPGENMTKLIRGLGARVLIDGGSTKEITTAFTGLVDEVAATSQEVAAGVKGLLRAGKKFFDAIRKE